MSLEKMEGEIRLFYGTGIPACILVFKKGRTATTSCSSTPPASNYGARIRTSLRDSDIARIVSTYEAREAKGGQVQLPRLPR